MIAVALVLIVVLEVVTLATVLRQRPRQWKAPKRRRVLDHPEELEAPEYEADLWAK